MMFTENRVLVLQGENVLDIGCINANILNASELYT